MKHEEVVADHACDKVEYSGMPNQFSRPRKQQVRLDAVGGMPLQAVRVLIAEFDGEYYTGGLNSSGLDLSAHTRFTATWVKGEDGEWRGLTHHGTRYDPAAPEKGYH